jgi:hypothetical protein
LVNFFIFILKYSILPAWKSLIIMDNFPDTRVIENVVGRGSTPSLTLPHAG